jgi:uncharacterized DUF497 family protein
MKFINLDFDFDPAKNLKLKQERGVSFEEIVIAIQEGHVLDVIDHYSDDKYKHQKMYIIEIENYVYLVPFTVQSDNKVFLKTIFPSRKFTKQYLRQTLKASELYE